MLRDHFTLPRALRAGLSPTRSRVGMPRAPRLPRAAPAALSRSPRTETRASSAAQGRHGGGSSSARRFHRCCPSSPLSAIASRGSPRKAPPRSERRTSPRPRSSPIASTLRLRTRRGLRQCARPPCFSRTRASARTRERRGALLCGSRGCHAKRLAAKSAAPSATPWAALSDEISDKVTARAPAAGDAAKVAGEVLAAQSAQLGAEPSAMVGDKLIASAALAQLGAAQAHHGGRRRARRAHVAAEAELVSTISGMCSCLLELRKAFGASLWLLCTRCRSRSRAKIACARGKLLAAHTRAHERARACEELADH